MMHVSMNTYFWVADGSPADYKPEIPTKALIKSIFFKITNWIFYTFHDARLNEHEFWGADGSPAEYKPEIPTKSLILSRFF